MISPIIISFGATNLGVGIGISSRDRDIVTVVPCHDIVTFGNRTRAIVPQMVTDHKR